MQDISTFFTHLAIILGAIGTILAIVKKWINAASKNVQTGLEHILQDNGTALLRQFESIPPETYLTLDFRQVDGSRELFVPLHPIHIAEPLTGLRLRLIAARSDCSLYEIDTVNHPLPIRIPWHHHDGTETVTLIEGTMTDTSTGRVYRSGETWEIPPGTDHTTEFHCAFAVARMRPPLPTGKTRPMKIEGITHIYDNHQRRAS
jgi:hypothetical protein